MYTEPLQRCYEAPLKSVRNRWYLILFSPPPPSLSLSLSVADECDALLGRGGEGENDAMRRLKNEFLQCFDGVGVASVDCFTN